MRGSKLMKSFLVTMLFLAGLTINTAGAAPGDGAKAGKTLLAVGDVYTTRESGKTPLKRRSAIFENDEIHVGSNGRAQFRMIDSALISLKENSVLRISEYKYQPGTTQKNSAVLELVSGGLRTITGAVGKNNKKAYELKTPFATIGIRGTNYEVIIIGKDTYVGVWDGEITVLSPSGNSIQLGPSQTFSFAKISPSGQIIGLKEIPSVFVGGNSEQKKNKTEKAEKQEKSEKNQKKDGSNQDDQESQDDSSTQDDQESDSQESIAIEQSSQQDVLPEFTTRDQSPTPLRGMLVNQNSLTTLLEGSASGLDSANPTFDVNGSEISSSNNTGTDFEQFVGGFPVSWGKFNEFTNGDTADSGLIWTAYDPTSPDAISTRSGTVRYDNVVDSLTSGNQGSVSNLDVQMDVDFNTGAVTNGSILANTSTDTWIGVFDGQVENGDLSLQLNGASVINTDINTPSDPRDASGFVDGDFVGTNAEGVIGSFGLTEDNTNNHIEGVFIVQ